MSFPPNRGKGAGFKFLQALLADAPPTCVPWPMFRDVNGYGRLGYNGKQWWAHTLMCTMVHGDAPSPGNEATHSCGNGKEGCVNPRHLLWGTRSRNQKDRRYHGTTAKGIWKGPRRKLTPEAVEQIRELRGKKTQREIAAQFGVADATIRDIYSGKSWQRPDPVFTVAEVLEIRKLADYLPIAHIADMFKCGTKRIINVVERRTYENVSDATALVA